MPRRIGCRCRPPRSRVRRRCSTSWPSLPDTAWSNRRPTTAKDTRGGVSGPRGRIDGVEDAGARRSEQAFVEIGHLELLHLLHGNFACPVYPVNPARDPGSRTASVHCGWDRVCAQSRNQRAVEPGIDQQRPSSYTPTQQLGVAVSLSVLSYLRAVGSGRGKLLSMAMGKSSLMARCRSPLVAR